MGLGVKRSARGKWKGWGERTLGAVAGPWSLPTPEGPWTRLSVGRAPGRCRGATSGWAALSPTVPPRPRAWSPAGPATSGTRGPSRRVALARTWGRHRRRRPRPGPPPPPLLPRPQIAAELLCTDKAPGGSGTRFRGRGAVGEGFGPRPPQGLDAATNPRDPSSVSRGPTAGKWDRSPGSGWFN